MSKVLYTDGDWKLIEGGSEINWPVSVHWLRHECTKGLTYRYGHSLCIPCMFCHAVAPVALQGLFNMVEHL